MQSVTKCAEKSPQKRARLCCHNGKHDYLQEMFIVLARGVDLQKSCHLNKDESITILQGKGSLSFFNEDKTIRKAFILSSPTENKKRIFFARINRFLPHQVKVFSKFLVFHESTTGPFYKSDTAFRHD